MKQGMQVENARAIGANAKSEITGTFRNHRQTHFCARSCHSHNQCYCDTVYHSYALMLKFVRLSLYGPGLGLVVDFADVMNNNRALYQSFGTFRARIDHRPHIQFVVCIELD